MRNSSKFKRRFRTRPRKYKVARETPAEPAKPKLKSKPIPIVNNRFAAALNHFGAALLETSGIEHTGIKGSKREDAFRKFLAERLPKRYGVASGEVVDQLNTTGPQLDVLVYDQSRDFSFSDGEIHILPAEALLVSIEIKTKLNAGEVKKCCDAARRLRSLKPFKLALAGKDVGVGTNVRYFHCVFAYETDLVESEDWLKIEARRFRSHGAGDEHLIDSVYVLNRGLLNLNYNKGCVEGQNGIAITNFYFSILNFIEREGARRKETPYQNYASLLNNKWITLI